VAVDDAIAVTRWAFANAAKLDVDPLRVAIGGDSAGANLAAVVTHVARDAEELSFRLQLLIYPAVELGFIHQSYELNEEALPVLCETMEWFREHYLAGLEQLDDWRASPLRAPNFVGLPPAYVLTAGYDPLADEGRAYVEKLSGAGVSTHHRHYPGQFHGFLTMGVAFPTTQTALNEIGIALQEALEKVG
jgi:acetyl esterase